MNTLTLVVKRRDDIFARMYIGVEIYTMKKRSSTHE